MNGFHFIHDLAIILAVAAVVGWACQRIGLALIVGFLAAGIAVGPLSPWLQLVENVQRVDTLAQVGLVFLMFSIGLQLSLRRMRRLGLSLVFATVAGAVIIFHLSRVLAVGIIGWSAREGLFFAAMLMVSSSVVIGRILHDTGTNHQRAGQLAMGVSVIEAVLAVVMLTILNSIVQFGRGGGSRMPETLVMLGAFVVLASIAGLLLVPWMLRRMSVVSGEELQTLGIAALLFSLVVVAHMAGYSLALGAFLLGGIVAETPHRAQVERAFAGLRDVFGAVFFVTIGMKVDPLQLWREGFVIAGVAAFVLVVRPIAVATGLALIGTPLRDGLRTGLTVTPIGEFSFIIAQMGVAAAVVPARFYPIVVGVALLTGWLAPLVMRSSERITEGVLTRQPRWLRDWLRWYHRWLERIRRRGARNLFWQLSRKRVVQVSVGALFVTGIVVFSGQLFALVEEWLGRGRFSQHTLQLTFWTVLALVILAPLVAIWRNLSAMALVYAEISTRESASARRFRPLIETALKFAFALAIGLWLLAILPLDTDTIWLLGVGGAVAVVAILVLRRKLIYWHSEMEVEILNVIETGENRMSSATPWLQPHTDWNLQMIDCTLPDLADVQGKPIAELDLRARFGCSVVGIERQGFMIALPGPDAVLYPRDKLLLMGTREQVQAGRTFLVEVTGAAISDSVFEEVRMEAVTLPAWSRAAGRHLEELSPAREHGVQVAGLHRGGMRILNPTARELLREGDEILVLGTPVQLEEFKAWIRERPDTAEPNGGDTASA